MSAANSGSCTRTGPISWILDVLSSIWFGVFLLIVIFLYCSVGSALPPARQWFELTEMEWFDTWVFRALIGLFCLTLVTVTVRRIRLKVTNYGVWGVHAGMIVLCIGCVIYFGRKIEGDAAVYRRTAVIESPGMTAPVRFPLRPGTSMTVGEGENRYHVSLPMQGGLIPNFPLMTPGQEGRDAYAYNLAITPLKTGQQFSRMLLVGYPDLTNDVLATGQRAKSATGKALVDEDLKISLDYCPAEYFHVAGTAALYVRGPDDTEWEEYPIRRLPKYHEYVSDSSAVRWEEGASARERDLTLSVVKGGDYTEEKDLAVEVTAFLPYADDLREWRDGGEELNPVLGFSIESSQGVIRRQFAAFDPQRKGITLPDAKFQMLFQWVPDAAAAEALAARTNPRFAVEVPGKGVKIEVALTKLQAMGSLPVEGTDYTISLVSVNPSYAMASEQYRGQETAMALVGIQTPTRKIVRSVIAKWPEMSQDLDENMKRQGKIIDENIFIRFLDPSPQGLFFVAGPGDVGLRAVSRTLDGQAEVRAMKVGDEVPLGQYPAKVRVEFLYEKGREVDVPLVVAMRRREPMQQVGMHKSMIRVAIYDGQGVIHRWLSFSAYSHPSRGGYFPEQVTLRNGRTVELLYSRERERLPAPVALEEFVLETYPGGLRERDYVSHIRFARPDGQWGDLMTVKSNNPAEFNGYWFFQSMWDRPEPNVQYGGMAHTGLGVGNREGVNVMLAGTVLSILGMVYAFYVKPVIKRHGAVKIESQGTDDGRMTRGEALPKQVEA